LSNVPFSVIDTGEGGRGGGTAGWKTNSNQQGLLLRNCQHEASEEHPSACAPNVPWGCYLHLK